MEVITLYGRKASALRASDDEKVDYQNISSKRKVVVSSPFMESSTSKKQTLVKRDATSSIPIYTLNMKDYSPKKKVLNGKTSKKNEKKVRDFFNAYRLIFLGISLLILTIIPYTMFNFFNNKVDSGDWAKYIFAETLNSPVPEEVSILDEESGEMIQKELFTLEQLFDSKLLDAEEQFTFSLNQGEARFDNDGNLILEDGISVSSDSVTLGEPVTYSKYTVKSGDTIESITYKFGLRSISTLIAANNIKNVRTLRSGQKLTIPSQDGLIHTVSSGESLNALSVKYHISVEDILDTNDLASDILFIGQKLFMPGAKLDAETLRDSMGETFKCPIYSKWRLTSHFGIRNDPISGVVSSHTGIDMACPTGTPIYAAMSGTVIKSAWSNIYGNYIIIKHPNGYQTLYGHMTKYIVKAKTFVEQGTKIGYVGSTGYSTGPHLHFTVYKNGKRVDPLPLIKK